MCAVRRSSDCTLVSSTVAANEWRGARWSSEQIGKRPQPDGFYSERVKNARPLRERSRSAWRSLLGIVSGHARQSIDVARTNTEIPQPTRQTGPPTPPISESRTTAKIRDPTRQNSGPIAPPSFAPERGGVAGRVQKTYSSWSSGVPSGPTCASDRFVPVRMWASYATTLPCFVMDSTLAILPPPAFF
jgi:hypothetical protein